MGVANSLDATQRDLITSVAAKALASSSSEQVAGIINLFQSAPSGPVPSVPSRARKHQCRWCIETFDKKWNKERHEARKHPGEFEAASTSAGQREMTQPQSRKRSGAETSDSHSELDATSDDRPYKRSRFIDDEAVERVKSAHTPMEDNESEHQMSLTSSHEPSEEEADTEIQLQIVRLVQAKKDVEVVKSGELYGEDTRQELTEADAHIADCCTPFLSWLCVPAVTEAERLIKARRVDPKQLPDVKKNLAFIIKVVVGRKLCEPSQFKLELFTQGDVCKQLNAFLEERQVGDSRIYALFLLVKKVFVYLSGSESVRRREYIPPNTWNSWTCVETICSDSNTRRKQASRNRKLLGAEQCSKLNTVPTRSVPTADDLKMPALYGEKKKPAMVTQPPGGILDSHSVVPPRSDANELSTEELRQVVEGCLAYLNGRGIVEESRTKFISYLVTATLCLAMAPRQQVLRQLQLGSSFVKKNDGCYWIVMLAHMNKNGKATMFPVGKELTVAYDHYLQSVRPRMLAGKSHDYVFCKQSGDPPGPKFDFSDWTQGVCSEVIGRPVNCHAFRSALVTSYYKSGATQSEMNALADVMAHDPATARDYYFKEDAQKQATAIQDRMRRVYGLEAASEESPGPELAPVAAFAPSEPARPESPAVDVDGARNTMDYSE